ncbi:MAG: 4Fe-4S dicluster domain-containing protein [Acidimicrobiales bacterium]
MRHAKAVSERSEVSIRPLVMAARGLEELFGVLAEDGYEVLGPTVRDDAVVIEAITQPGQLPRGWGDAQTPGSYRLVERGDGAYFGFAVPAGTWKRHLFEPRAVLWRSRREGDGVVFEPGGHVRRLRAFLGIRGCDLAGIAVQDRVFGATERATERLGGDGSATERATERLGGSADPAYGARRDGVLFIGVNCSDPASTCFCTSMGTGTGIGERADLALTELDPALADQHRFLVHVTTDRGRAIADRMSLVAATDRDLASATAVRDGAIARMGRSMDTRDLPQILREAAEHPRWDDVALRCLSCGNCTMACPTCFCADVSDQPNVAAGVDERVREWASCFQLGHSYLHGGSVRVSTKARYRQWMTHKLSTWWDQFGVSGCVGCGRCITFCPVGIDITEEVRAIRASNPAPFEEKTAETREEGQSR